jgi:hypothetical protein
LNAEDPLGLEDIGIGFSEGQWGNGGDSAGIGGASGGEGGGGGGSSGGSGEGAGSSAVVSKPVGSTAGEGSDSNVAEPENISLGNLNESQEQNYKNYVKKLPSAHGEVTIIQLPDGDVKLNSSVPASNIPGSYADYTKVINGEGETQSYIKYTYDENGQLSEVKIKFSR